MFRYVLILMVWSQWRFFAQSDFASKLYRAKSFFFMNESYTDFETVLEASSVTCGNFGFCNSSYSKYISGPDCVSCQPCKCDDLCHEFGDCCADKNGTRERLTPKWTCVKRIAKSYYSLFAQMVSSCGDRENNAKFQDTVSKCIAPSEKHIEEVRPVTDPRTNVTFRNQFCAECNGVHHFELWSFLVECRFGAVDKMVDSMDRLWQSVFQSRDCRVQDVPPDWAPVRECYGNYIQTCDRNSAGYNKTVERLCISTYGSPTSPHDERVYQNIFCMLCNGVEPRRPCAAKGGVIPPITGLNVVIDFNPRPSVPNTMDLSQSGNETGCQQNETFDPITEQCKLIKCSPRRFLSNIVCRPIFTAKGMGYHFSLVVRFSQNLNVSYITKFTTQYTSEVRTKLEPYQPFAVFHLDYRRILPRVVEDLPENAFEETEGFVVNLMIVSRANANLEDMENSLRQLGNDTADIVLDNKTVQLHATGVQCPSYFVEGIHTTLEEKPMDSRFDVCVDGECSDYIDVFRVLGCPHIELNLSDINHSYYFENSTLSFLNHTVVLNKSFHIYCDGILQLCTNILPDIQKQLALVQNVTGNRALGIVSVVCISLSLVSLFVTFVIFCIIPQLRTLPGKNTMALMFHLFCAQLLFQTGINATDSVILCQIMGILIHYFWLTTFSWMAVSAYHMCITFSNLSFTEVLKGNREMKIMAKYTAVCAIISLTAICCCAGYHLGTSKLQNIGYGGRICFLQEPVDIGIFFAAPLGLILLFNIVCFVKTIISIRAVPDMGSVKNKANKTHAVVYFRLSVFLGFTWVFGFIASALQNDVFWYIFVVLNGLQGVFISVAYCGNMRTVNLIKEHLSSSLSRLSVWTSSSSEVTRTTSM